MPYKNIRWHHWQYFKLEDNIIIYVCNFTHKHIHAQYFVSFKRYELIKLSKYELIIYIYLFEPELDGAALWKTDP